MDPLTTTDPEQIDEYTLEGRLGAGGYGVVYAATDAEGRRVALKVLRPELAAVSYTHLTLPTICSV